MSRLLIDHSGERITLLGIFTIDPKTDLIEKTNTVLNHIKEELLQSPRIKEISAASISERLKIPESQIGLILYLSVRYRSIIGSASISQTYFGYNSINPQDNDEAFDQLINFSSIEDAIWSDFEKEALNEVKNDTLKKSSTMPQNGGQSLILNPIFSSKITSIDSKLCFVLMPFSQKWSERVYKKLIRENIESLGLQCIRADNLTGPIVIEDIWTKINQAAFIIADVTDRNPNVMYEMGIVHTIGKTTILITQDINKIPFDFRHLRHNEYADNSDSFELFGDKLKQLVIDLYKREYPDVILESV